MPMLSKKKVEELRKTRLFRIINTKDGHNGYMYKVGLNEDPEEFSTTGGCVRGGLYFTNVENLASFWKYGDRVAEVEIPEGEPVFEVHNDGPLKYRAKRIIISSLYKKGDIIDKLVEMGLCRYTGGDNLQDDVLNGEIDLKYIDLGRIHLSKVLCAKIPAERKVELLKKCKELGKDMSYCTNNLDNDNISLVIQVGYKIPASYVTEQIDGCFYTAPVHCKFLLDHIDGFIPVYKIDRWVKSGHVAIIRELAKRDMIPVGRKIEFEYYVSKDRRSEIRKLCAK